jgi:hypothetical protein
MLPAGLLFLSFHNRPVVDASILPLPPTQCLTAGPLQTERRQKKGIARRLGSPCLGNA